MEEAATAGENTDGSLPTELTELVALLESRERVIDVCKALRSLIDANDDHYVVQIELASFGVIPALIGLLSLENTAEVIEVCETVVALCANIEGVSVRKRSGLETGFMERSFNPVQDELTDIDGVRKLTNLLDSNSEGVKDAAIQSLWACCSFNHSNKMSYLRCLVHDLLDNKNERLERINALLPDIEIRDEASVMLDQVMLPVLKIVKDKNHAFKKDALSLMGTLCERHPASASFLSEEGALEPIVSTVLQDSGNRSKAVHVFWHLIRQNKSVLSPNRGKLGCEGTLLIEPLVSIIGWDKKTNPDPEQDDQEDDYSDEALLVLKALAEQDEEVREKVGDFADSGKSPCAVM